MARDVAPRTTAKHTILFAYNKDTSSAEYNIIKCLFNYDSITGLTCTVDSISTKTSIADTLKATNGVITGGIFMAVINFSCTVINICNEQVVQLCYQHPSKNKHPLQIVHIGKQQFCGVCEQSDFSTQTPARIYSGCLMPVLSPQKFSSPCTKHLITGNCCTNAQQS